MTGEGSKAGGMLVLLPALAYKIDTLLSDKERFDRMR